MCTSVEFIERRMQYFMKYIRVLYVLCLVNPLLDFLLLWIISPTTQPFKSQWLQWVLSVVTLKELYVFDPQNVFLCSKLFSQ